MCMQLCDICACSCVKVSRFFILGQLNSSIEITVLLDNFFAVTVVGAEVNFDNSKDSGEGCAVNPIKSS